MTTECQFLNVSFSTLSQQGTTSDPPLQYVFSDNLGEQVKQLRLATPATQVKPFKGDGQFKVGAVFEELGFTTWID